MQPTLNHSPAGTDSGPTGKLNVPIATVTHIFSRFSKRAVTATEKNYLYQLVEALGTNIKATQPTGFDMDEFAKECGIDPVWAKAA